jgi:modification methylase
MKSDGQYQLVFGDSSNMDIIRNGEVDLVLTSPPYFSSETEALLKEPIKQQNQIDRVRKEITSFAYGIRPVYEEIDRVLKVDGILVIQIKDIHYANVLISLASCHREMVESLGYNLVSRVFWHKMSHRSPSHKFLKKRTVGSFRTDQVEEIYIFSKAEIMERKGTSIQLDEEEIQKCGSPYWNMAPAGKNRIHPDQSPKALIRRNIALFTEPGDLVVDPFAGSGLTLAIAVEMGRRAIGYEIGESYAKAADSYVEKSAKESLR